MNRLMKRMGLTRIYKRKPYYVFMEPNLLKFVMFEIYKEGTVVNIYDNPQELMVDLVNVPDPYIFEECKRIIGALT